MSLASSVRLKWRSTVVRGSVNLLASSMKVLTDWMLCERCGRTYMPEAERLDCVNGFRELKDIGTFRSSGQEFSKGPAFFAEQRAGR